jgi:hypothetical protein
MILRISLYALAALLVAAHFLRQGDIPLALLCLSTPALFAIRKRWSLLVLQGAAHIATAVWMATAVNIVRERLAVGRGYATALAILAGVAGLTLLAGILLNSRTAQQKYPARLPARHNGD